jgi:hypothetical protein
MPADIAGTFKYISPLKGYSVGLSGSEEGIAGIVVGNDGVLAGSAAFSISESKMDFPVFDSPDEGRTNAASMHNTTSEPASVHVAFSRKSAVLRTPIIWLEAEKLAAKPPPLEFCTNTISVKNTQTATISMDINVNMNIFYFYSFNLSIWAAK